MQKSLEKLFCHAEIHIGKDFITKAILSGSGRVK